MNKKNIILFLILLFCVMSFYFIFRARENQVFFIFVFRKKEGDIQLLLKKRAIKKDHYPGVWENTCCSYLNHGEFLVEAAKKRLKLETGIEIKDLYGILSFNYKERLKNGLTKSWLDHVLIGKFDAEYINFNPEEADAVLWVSIDKLKQRLIEKPKTFAPWFKLLFSKIKQKHINNLFK